MRTRNVLRGASWIAGVVLTTSGPLAAATMPLVQSTTSPSQSTDLQRPTWEGAPPSAVPVPGAPGALSHKDVPQGFVLIEGDIQVKLSDYVAHLTEQASVFGGNGIGFWWSMVVPFDFVTSGSGAVTPANQQKCIAAMDDIAARTGLTFRPAVSDDADRIRFQSSDGNNSPVGCIGGTQTINLFNFNVNFIIIHELYHSLGFWHQQSASNRDSYITINYGNICTNCCPGGSDCSYNFNIISDAWIYGEYDFDSFMHYGRTAFTVNGQDTIVVNPPWSAEWQSSIGQRNHFSYWDELVCRGLYPKPLDWWWSRFDSADLLFPQAGNLLDPITSNNIWHLGWTLPTMLTSLPAGSTLFIKDPGMYSVVGTFTNPITIRAPLGATLGGQLG